MAQDTLPECPAWKHTRGQERTGQGKLRRRGQRYQLEQGMNLLRQIEVAVANGKATAQALKRAGIVEKTYFRRSMAVCR